MEENEANGSLNKEGEVNEHLYSPTVSGITVWSDNENQF